MSERSKWTNVPIARDASAILNLEPGKIEVRDGVHGAWVPSTFIRRSKRVAGFALSQITGKVTQKPKPGAR